MKGLALCICVLILASSSSHSVEIHTSIEDVEEMTMHKATKACLCERNTINDNIDTIEIMLWTYSVSGRWRGSEEGENKTDCLMTCILKKQNLMEGSNIKEEAALIKLSEQFEDRDAGHKVVRKCLEEARSIAEECQKGVFLNACIMERTREQTENREEHKKEEIEGEGEPVKKLISVICPIIDMSTSSNLCQYKICNMG